MWWGVVAERVAWSGFNYTARPPVILPGAAVASLRLAGAFALGFALWARAVACCLIEGAPVSLFHIDGYEMGGLGTGNGAEAGIGPVPSSP